MVKFFCCCLGMKKELSIFRKLLLTATKLKSQLTIHNWHHNKCSVNEDSICEMQGDPCWGGIFKFNIAHFCSYLLIRATEINNPDIVWKVSLFSERRMTNDKSANLVIIQEKGVRKLCLEFFKFLNYSVYLNSPYTDLY